MSKQIRSPLIKSADYPQPLINAISAVALFPKGYPQPKDTFLRGLCASVSLNLAEKHRVLTELPRMAHFQLSMLCRVWSEEEMKSQSQLAENWGDGVILVARSWINNSLLATHLGARWNSRMEASAMQNYVHSHYARNGRRALLKAALAKTRSAQAEHVFGRALISCSGALRSDADESFRI